MKKVIAILAFALVSVSAHAQLFGGYGGYEGNQQERQISAGQYGQNNALRGSVETIEVEVVHVRNVKIQKNPSGMKNAMYTGGGAALGGLLGSMVGGGGGQKILTVVGGLGGALFGSAMASPTVVDAQEVTIRRIGGTKMVTVAQAGSYMRVGMHALAADVGGELRIFPMEAPIQQAPAPAVAEASSLSNM